MIPTVRPVIVYPSPTLTLPMSGARLWWTVRDTSTLGLDGSNNLLTWNDKSGNGSTGDSSASALRPVYGLKNGINAVRFSTNSSSVSVVDGTYVNTGTTCTVYLAFCMEGGGATARLVALSSNVSTSALNATSRGVPYSRSSSQVRGVVNSAALSASTGLAADTWYVGASRWDGTNHQMFIGSNTYTAVGSAPTWSVGVVRLGNNTTTSTSDRYQGAIAELALYNEAHSDVQVLNMISSIRSGLGV